MLYRIATVFDHPRLLPAALALSLVPLLGTQLPDGTALHGFLSVWQLLMTVGFVLSGVLCLATAHHRGHQHAGWDYTALGLFLAAILSASSLVNFGQEHSASYLHYWHLLGFPILLALPIAAWLFAARHPVLGSPLLLSAAAAALGFAAYGLYAHSLTTDSTQAVQSTVVSLFFQGTAAVLLLSRLAHAYLQSVQLDTQGVGARSRFLERLFLFGLTLFCLLLFVARLGDYPLWDPWEPKYGQAMLEMLSRHDYVTPYMNGEIRWTKPILYYWTMLPGMLVDGVGEFTTRYPSALGALFAVLFIYWTLRRSCGTATAVLGAAILATTPQLFYLARQAMPDMLLTVFITASLCSYAVARFGHTDSHPWYLAFWGFAALAFLTKGPVAIVVILFTLFLYWAAETDPGLLLKPRQGLQRFWTVVREHHPWQGIALFSALAGPWYVMMLLRHGQAFIDNFIGYENLERFNEVLRGHHGLGNFYVDNLLHGMYPWSALLPGMLLFTFSGPQRRFRQEWFYFSWFIAVFVIFTLAGTKQSHYILPIVAPFAVLCALFLERFRSGQLGRWAQPSWLLSAFVMAIVIKDFIVEGDRYIFNIFTLRYDIDNVNVEPFLLGLLAVWLMIAVWGVFDRARNWVLALAIGCAAANAIYFVHQVMPGHSETRSFHDYIQHYDHYASQNKGLLFFSSRNKPSVYYYYRGPYLRYTYRQMDRIKDYIDDHDSVFIISQKRYQWRLERMLDNLKNYHWVELADSHQTYSLILVEHD